MTRNSLKKRREIIKVLFSAKEWCTQDDYRKGCISNFVSYRDSGILCKADCSKCKVHDYIPLGLESLLQGGFLGIVKKQQKREKAGGLE